MNRDRYSGESSRVFEEACGSDDVTQLRELINEDKFVINRRIVCFNELPLAMASSSGSLPVVELLLDNGADLNIGRGRPLFMAVMSSRRCIVRLLLDRGAKITPRLLVTAIDSYTYYQSERREILELFLVNLSQRLDRPNVDATSRILGTYARLSMAVLQCDKTRMNQLLAEDCQGPLEVVYRNRRLTLRAGRFTFKRLNFYPDDLEGLDDNALHVACRFHKLEAIKFLVQEHGMKLDEPNIYDRTPLFEITDPEFLYDLFSIFPEINIGLTTNVHNNLLKKFFNHCDFYVILLEHGARFSLNKDSHDHLDCDHYEDKKKCQGIPYLRRLRLIDGDYVNNLLSIWTSGPRFEYMNKNFDATGGTEYEDEIEKMKGIKISQGTTFAKAKSLFDVIFFDANEAARYSRNEVFLGIYQDSDQDFRKLFPNYGFALNHQLRRGRIRRERQGAAFELFCEAIGQGLPEAYSEYLFGHLSNRSLERFIS